MAKSITIQSPEVVSIDYKAPIVPPIIDVSVDINSSVSFGLPQDLSIMLIAPDE